MNKDELPQLITPKTLASLTLQPGEDIKSKAMSIRKQCRDGTIPSRRVGNCIYIPRDMVVGELAPQPVVVDASGAQKIVDAIKEMLASGKSLTLEIKEAEVA